MARARARFFAQSTTEGPGDFVVVPKTALAVSLFGAGSTALTEDESAVTLRFHGRYLANALDEPPAFTPFATLELSGRVTGSPPRAVLTVPPGALIVYDEPLDEENTPRRILSLDYPTPDFEGSVAKDDELRSLRLPVEAADQPDARYFELGVVLLVNGAEEGPLDKNDVLDIPLRPMSVGVVVEWPEELDEIAPPGLTLVATRGDRTRMIRWVDGVSRDGRRKFLFRGLVGSAPVDLVARFNGRSEALWEAQDISNPDKPPAWTTTLEDALTAGVQTAPSDFRPERDVPPPQPKSPEPLELPGMFDALA